MFLMTSETSPNIPEKKNLVDGAANPLNIAYKSTIKDSEDILEKIFEKKNFKPRALKIDLKSSHWW